MRSLSHLLSQNRKWAEKIRQKDPEFFLRLSRQQTPEYLWIGCADSRVPANDIVGLLPGEMFVHRNIANVVDPTDLNCLSVIQFAVDLLKVNHIMVVGHYGCSGVQAALSGQRVGLADKWLRHVRDVREKHKQRLLALRHEAGLPDRLCELNVIEQAANVCSTSIVQGAWKRGQPLHVHAWIYSIQDGLLRDLNATVTSASDVAERQRAALDALDLRYSENASCSNNYG